MFSTVEPGIEEQFRQFLRSQGLKFTRERRHILSEVFGIHEHFEVEDVVRRLGEHGRPASRASVYRALPALVESGLIREVHSTEKGSRYEHVHEHEHHDHMICVECGRIIEFNNPALEALEEETCRAEGFLPRFHTLEIHGVCRDCQAADCGIREK